MVAFIGETKQPLPQHAVECLPHICITVGREAGQVVQLSGCRGVIEVFNGDDIGVTEPDKRLRYLVAVFEGATIHSLGESKEACHTHTSVLMDEGAEARPS